MDVYRKNGLSWLNVKKMFAVVFQRFINPWRRIFLILRWVFTGKLPGVKIYRQQERLYIEVDKDLIVKYRFAFFNCDPETVQFQAIEKIGEIKADESLCHLG